MVPSRTADDAAARPELRHRAGGHARRGAWTMSIATPVLGVINAGSSSLKFAVYDREALVLSGQVDGIGVHPGIRVTGARGEALDAPDIAHASPTVPADVLPDTSSHGCASSWAD